MVFKYIYADRRILKAMLRSKVPYGREIVHVCFCLHVSFRHCNLTLPPLYSQNGMLWSFCTKCGPLKLYLYSNRIFGSSAFITINAINSKNTATLIMRLQTKYGSFKCALYLSKGRHLFIILYTNRQMYCLLGHKMLKVIKV